VIAFPDLPPMLAQSANDALQCAANPQPSGLFLVADMSLPSSERRLWVFRIRDGEPELIARDYVAHGAGSDFDRDGRAETFSNRVNSNATSLGIYRIAEPYYGKYGRSYRLDGLLTHWNDQARERAVVLHHAPYVRPASVGRSFGCPAVREEVLRQLSSEGLEDALLYIHSSDPIFQQDLQRCAKREFFCETPNTPHFPHTFGA